MTEARTVVLVQFGKYLKQANPSAWDTLHGIAGQLRKLSRKARRAGAVECVDEARPELMGLDGVAGRLYWQGVSVLLEGHAPFPGRRRRGASDPVNSALNYGYGILYSQVWGALINAAPDVPLQVVMGLAGELDTLVIYDIEVDRTRNRIAEVCKDYGLERVQYSVFFGSLSRNLREEFPVDFKFSQQPPRRNHAVQLAAYAVLLEERFSRPVKEGFVYLIPLEKPVVIPITDRLKQECQSCWTSSASRFAKACCRRPLR